MFCVGLYAHMIMLVFVFGSIFHIWKKTCNLYFSECILLNMMFSSSIHLPANYKISFLFIAEWYSIVLGGVYIYHIFFLFIYLFIIIHMCIQCLGPFSPLPPPPPLPPTPHPPSPC
jgi:hypothetical protein